MIGNQHAPQAACLFRALGCLLMAGCAAQGTSVGPTSRCDAAKEVRAVLYPLGTSTDAEEADVASRVLPGGFGGLHMDIERSILRVSLTDPSMVAEVGPALDSLLNCGAAYPGRVGTAISLTPKEFVAGRFTGQQLQDWFRRLQPEVAAHAWAFEIDPIQTLLWIGVNGPADSAVVAETSARLGIPRTGLQIETPPSDSAAGAFRLADRGLVTQAVAGVGFYISPRLIHGNQLPHPVYQDRCAVGGQPGRTEPFARLERWEGSSWRVVYRPFCVAVLLLNPIVVQPGGVREDTVGITHVTRLNSRPTWDVIRVAGTYRLVVPLFRSAVGSPPVLQDPLPDSVGRSETFRLRVR